MRFSFIATILPALLSSFKPCDRQSLKSASQLDEVGRTPNKRDGGPLRQRWPSAATIPRRVLPLHGGAARPLASNPAAPLSCLNREAGLAAVAAELHVQISTLEREVAEAIERGAAALFLAGFGPRLTKAGQTVGSGGEGPRGPQASSPARPEAARGGRTANAGTKYLRYRTRTAPGAFYSTNAARPRSIQRPSDRGAPSTNFRFGGLNHAIPDIGDLAASVRSAARFLGSVMRTFPMSSASAVVNAASPAAFTPPDIVKRETATRERPQAETIRITQPRPTEFGFRRPRHLAMAYEQAARDDGEAQVEGLRSNLHDPSGKLAFIPTHGRYYGWQEPRVLTRVAYFYIDPSCALRDPELRFERHGIRAAAVLFRRRHLGDDA